MNATKITHGTKGKNNFVYVAPAKSDLHVWHNQIVAALKATGNMPEEFEDLFTVECLKGHNEDGTDRFIIRFA